MFLQLDKEFYSVRVTKIDFSRLEALVGKREFLLKFIYEKRRKGATLADYLSEIAFISQKISANFMPSQGIHIGQTEFLWAVRVLSPVFDKILDSLQEKVDFFIGDVDRRRDSHGISSCFLAPDRPDHQIILFPDVINDFRRVHSI